MCVKLSISSFRLFLFSCCSLPCFRNLRGFRSVNICTLVLSCITAIVIPSTLSAIVVVSQDECVDGSGVALGIFNVCYAVEFFADGALNDDILLVLVIFAVGFEVKLVIVCIRDYNFGLLHVYADR